MPLHRLLAEHPKLVAAQGAQSKARGAAEAPNRQHASAVATWETQAVECLSEGREAPARPEPPDDAVLMKLRQRAELAGRFVDQVKAGIAPEVEAACRHLEQELLAEVEQHRARLAEIAQEGMALAQTVQHLDNATYRPGRHPLAGDLDPPTLLRHTATGQGWIAPIAP